MPNLSRAGMAELGSANTKAFKGIVWKMSIGKGSNNMGAKFEITKDKSGEFRFKLIAPNNQVIAVSEGYTNKESALKGIASVKENAAKAATEDKTV
jgi:uncharacterized protein YegP (UPF0339 family)